MTYFKSTCPPIQFITKNGEPLLNASFRRLQNFCARSTFLRHEAIRVVRGDSPEISHDWWCNLYISTFSIYKYTIFFFNFSSFSWWNCFKDLWVYETRSKKNACIYSRQDNLLLRIVVAENSYKHLLSSVVGWNWETPNIKPWNKHMVLLHSFGNCFPFLPLCSLPITTTQLSPIRFWWLSHLSLIIREEEIAR